MTVVLCREHSECRLAAELEAPGCVTALVPCQRPAAGETRRAWAAFTAAGTVLARAVASSWRRRLAGRRS